MAEYHYSNYIERPVPEGSAKFSTDTVDVQLYQALLRSLAWRMSGSLPNCLTQRN